MTKHTIPAPLWLDPGGPRPASGRLPSGGCPQSPQVPLRARGCRPQFPGRARLCRMSRRIGGRRNAGRARAHTRRLNDSAVGVPALDSQVTVWNSAPSRKAVHERRFDEQSISSRRTRARVPVASPQSWSRRWCCSNQPPIDRVVEIPPRTSELESPHIQSADDYAWDPSRWRPCPPIDAESASRSSGLPRRSSRRRNASPTAGSSGTHFV